MDPGKMPCRWYRVPIGSYSKNEGIDKWPCWLVRSRGFVADVLFVDGEIQTVGARNVRRERERDPLLDREAALRVDVRVKAEGGAR